jgi:polysaccharide pyruvyl transferase WcaK-like protein
MLEKLSGLQVTKNILVYGWYNQNNLGDDLFIEAFKKIFPQYNFIFTDCIEENNLQNIDAVFFGGGSFLGEPLKYIGSNTLNILKSKKIFYIGVGAETSIDENHLQLLKLSSLIALRSGVNFNEIKDLNNNVIIIRDLVYALDFNINESKIEKSILFIPNITLVPKWSYPHWQHAAWDYFKIETAQLLDYYIKEGFTINFLPLCTNNELNDRNAAIEIINRMDSGNLNLILEKPKDINSIINILSKYNIVITQRFHGSILSEMAGVSAITIYHHDKLKNVNGEKVSYYGSSKNILIEKINNILYSKIDPVLPIDRNIFIDLKQKVEYEICRS